MAIMWRGAFKRESTKTGVCQKIKQQRRVSYQHRALNSALALALATRRSISASRRSIWAALSSQRRRRRRGGVTAAAAAAAAKVAAAAAVQLPAS